jgi:hypothetical protein
MRSSEDNVFEMKIFEDIDKNKTNQNLYGFDKGRFDPLIKHSQIIYESDTHNLELKSSFKQDVANILRF